MSEHEEEKVSKYDAYARNKLLNLLVSECQELGFEYNLYDDHVVIWIGNQS